MERFLLYATGIGKQSLCQLLHGATHPCCNGILTWETTEYMGVCVRRRRLRQRYTGSETARIAGVGLLYVGLRRHLGLPLESRGHGKLYGRMRVQARQGDCFPCRVGATPFSI